MSSKDIYPSKNNVQKPSYAVKDVRSVEKKSEPPKREERVIYNGSTSTSNTQTRVIKAPEVKTRVVYESTSHVQSQPQPRVDNLPEEYALGALDLNNEDHELQMAIMQSMGGVAKKAPSYSVENEWNNPSFIAQQKAIEEEFKRRH